MPALECFPTFRKTSGRSKCKRKKEIGSNLPRIVCLTEAEVRVQVQNMQKYRDDMRQRTGRCVLGSGCRCDGGPNAAGN